ncbi:MAG: hypothetical protein E7399_08735 [Ruminococcaceae bacterium]|nr:hypothetical protein [Oscillospiraceae bacterium]
MRITIPSASAASASERGIAEFWFYDTMDGGINAFYINTVGDSRRIRVKLNPSTYYASSEKGTTVVKSNTLTRTRGWHQFIIDYRTDNRIDMYIDGTLLAYTEGEGANTGIRVYHDFMLNPTGMSDYSTPLQSELYYDDITRYNMTWTNKPSLETNEISSLDLSKNTTYFAEGGTGQVKVIGTFANGQKAELTGDAGLSYTVSHPDVLAVNENGSITALKTGYALVTITAGGVSESLVYTVTNSKSVIHDANNSAITGSFSYSTDASYFEQSKEIYRTGNQSYRMLKSHAWNTRTNYINNENHSFVFSGWLYDDGVGSGNVPRFEIGSTNANDVQDGVTVLQNVKNMTVQLGIYNTNTPYYHIVNNAANRANWAPGTTQGRKSESGHYLGNPFSGYTNGESKGSTNSFTNPVTKTVTSMQGATMKKVERTKGWHQFAVVCDGGGTTPVNVATPNGKIEFYIDGELVYTDRYVSNRCYLLWLLGTGYISDYQVTHFAVDRKAPVVSVPSLGTDGNIVSGTAYNASATATDPNGYDQESTIAYTWQVSDNGADGWTDVSTNQNYTPEDAGKYVRVLAVPTGTIDKQMGEETKSVVKQIGVANPELTFAISGKGIIKNSEATYQNGETLRVGNGDNVTLTLVPEEGYEISSLKVDGKDLVVTDSDVILENMSLDTEVSVVYTEKEKTKPNLIASESGIQLQKEYIPAGETDARFAALAYTKIDVGYGYQIKDVGVKLENENGDFAMLPHLGTWEETYLFGVRVYGAGLIDGETYSMTPYLVINGDTEEYIFGQQQNFTKE